jgi:outer membrane lipoprotein-sorting protein
MKRELRSAVILGLFFLAACTPKAPTLPSGSGGPFPGFESAYEQAIAECRNVRTLSAALELSGRAGRTRLRGTIHAGFEAPDALRLEGVGPFGRTVFILVAKDGDSTLLLPRDRRVLRKAAPAAIVEALAGVALQPRELRAALAGCGFQTIQPAAGRTYERGWAAVDASDSRAAVFLRQIDARWRVAAMSHGPLTIHYGEFASGRPSMIRIRTTPAGTGAATDLTVRPSQVEINVALAPAVFEVEVPADAVPLTLDELRRAGPLGEAR